METTITTTQPDRELFPFLTDIDPHYVEKTHQSFLSGVFDAKEGRECQALMFSFTGIVDRNREGYEFGGGVIFHTLLHTAYGIERIQHSIPAHHHWRPR